MVKYGIDADVCASLLRGITDQLMENYKPPSPTASLSEIITEVRAISDAASNWLRESLHAHFPDVAWTAEEIDSGDQHQKGPHWIYDPIDGAYHYLQGLPLWSSTLVLMHDDTPVFSVVYEPTSRELFSAFREGGASLNGKPIHVSAKTTLNAAVLGTAIPPRAAVSPEEHTQSITQLAAITQEVFVVRPMASASLQLAYVAAGRLDGYWEVGHDVNDWWAGALLVKEAGGRVSGFTADSIGIDVDGIVAAPESLHKLIRNHIA